MPAIPAIGGLGAGASIGPIDGATTGTGAASGAGSSSFGSALANQLGSLEKSQNAAADASRSLADGTATDPTQAIVAVERAQLSMQLAAQLRTKGVEALQEIFRTQV
jgi:flagellar hook-basal body complex protein FliE